MTRVAHRVYRNRRARTDAPCIMRAAPRTYYVGDSRLGLALYTEATGPFLTFEAAEMHWLLVKDEVIL